MKRLVSTMKAGIDDEEADIYDEGLYERIIYDA